MGRSPQDVTEAELAILKVLWDANDCTIRQITDSVYPRGSESDYATVKKLLARLEEKKCVKKDRRQIPHKFAAIISRDDLVGRRLRTLADHLCDGSAAPLLMHLLEGKGISANQQRELRELIEEYSDNQSSPKNSARKKN